MIFVGENIDYMPAKELAELKEKTMAEISKQRQTVDEQAASSNEKRQRAESFDKLYAEGVVSRRELEGSKTESEKAERDLKELKQSLNGLEQKFARIEKRLADLAKQKSTSKSKKKH